MTVATVNPAPAGAGPLDESHHQELALAHARAAKVRNAARVAGFNGWATACFAVFSAPFALFSISGLIVAVGLAVVAYNEFKGRRRLLEFDPSVTRLLGWNQLGFLALIVVYCLWMLVTGLTGESPIAAEVRAKPELAVALDDLEQFDQLYRLLIGAVYGAVIVLSILFQGVNAMYYFSRRKHLEDYLRETPEWVVDLQRRTPAS